MDALIKFLLFWLVLLNRTFAMNNTFRIIPKEKVALSPPILDNVTSIRIVPHYQNLSPEVIRYENYSNQYFPLFNPCFNPFLSNRDKEIKTLDPYWLKTGEKHLLELKQHINKAKKEERHWINDHIIPRLTFLWSFYELATNASSLQLTYQIGIKHAVAHSLIRTIGFQEQYQLKFHAEYYSDQTLLTKQWIDNIHILVLKGKGSGLIPLLIFNPPQTLLGVKAQHGLVYHLWNEIVDHLPTLIANPYKSFLFSPYHHPDAIQLHHLDTIGIFSAVDSFELPHFISQPTRNLLLKELAVFKKACALFALKEEKRFVLAEAHSLSLPTYFHTKNIT